MNACVHICRFLCVYLCRHVGVCIDIGLCVCAWGDSHVSILCVCVLISRSSFGDGRGKCASNVSAFSICFKWTVVHLQRSIFLGKNITKNKKSGPRTAIGSIFSDTKCSLHPEVRIDWKNVKYKMETSGFLCLRTWCVISQEAVCLRACLCLSVLCSVHRAESPGLRRPQRAARHVCSIREGEEPSRCESMSVSGGIWGLISIRPDSFRSMKQLLVCSLQWGEFPSIVSAHCCTGCNKQRVNHKIGHVELSVLWLCLDRMDVLGLHYTSVQFDQHTFSR